MLIQLVLVVPLVPVTYTIHLHTKQKDKREARQRGIIENNSATQNKK